MLKIAVLLLTTGLMVANEASAQGEKTEGRTSGAAMDTQVKNVEVMLKIFRAIEQRDHQAMVDLLQPDIEMDWPPSLPYGGTGHSANRKRPSWGEVWLPLQPTEVERRMDPRVVGARGDEVVVLWQQRGISPGGERFEGEVLGLYRLRDGKLARAQMFYFDEAGLAAFLARAQSKAGTAGRPAGVGSPHP